MEKLDDMFIKGQYTPSFDPVPRNTHCRILPMRNQLRKEEFNHNPVSDLHNIILHGMNSRSTCVHYNCSVHALYYMHNNVFILMTWEMRKRKRNNLERSIKRMEKGGKGSILEVTSALQPKLHLTAHNQRVPVQCHRKCSQ